MPAPPDGAAPATETWVFEVPRPVDRVIRSLRRTDDWIPLLFSRGYDGKRTKGRQGKAGAVYLSTLYRMTTAFSAEKRETFRVVEFGEHHLLLSFRPDRSDRFWNYPPPVAPPPQPTERNHDHASEAHQHNPPPPPPARDLFVRLSWEAVVDGGTRLRLEEPPCPAFRWGARQALLVAATCGVLWCDHQRDAAHRAHRANCHEELKLYLLSH